MWKCKTCSTEYDEWVDECYKCNISRSKNDSNQESCSENEENQTNDNESRFEKLRSYSNLIISLGYILAGVEILYALFLLNNLYYMGGTGGLFIVIATAISVALTIITFVIIGHTILVFLDIEENTRQTSKKLEEVSILIKKNK